MRKTREQECLAYLQHLVSICVDTLSALHETVATLQAELERFSVGAANKDGDVGSDRTPEAPVIDHGTMCVCYHGKHCFLGDTLMLRFLEQLAARPDYYFTHRELLSSVWSGTLVEPCSIRSVVRDLRARLRNAGLHDLAESINSQVRGHYGLFLHKKP